jgi:hypothetical protein
VLLSDVSIRTPREGEYFDAVEAFKDSKWFRRGWTLQELIAPGSVVFYLKEKRRLGDKQELEKAVAVVTKIPIMVLQGVKLSYFSKQERFSWAEHRTTTVPEDAAYCLLGICNVRMHTSYADGIYSERKKEALYELDRTIKDASENAQQGEEVIRIGGASWCDLSRLDKTQLRELNRELEGYMRWLVDLSPSEIKALNNTDKLSQTVERKLRRCWQISESPTTIYPASRLR